MRRLIEIAYEITHRCNLRCRHCYNQDYINKTDEMSTAQVFAALGQAEALGVQKLKIGGGEPVLREDLFEVYDYATNLGLEVNFSSNGLLIPKYIGEIKRHKIEKLQISLDNIGEKHDEFRNYQGLFEKVKESIELLNKNNVKINIATTLTTQNHKDLEKILDFCSQHKVFRWKVMKYIPQNAEDPLLLSKIDYKDAVHKLIRYKEETKIPEIIVAREFDLIKVPSDYNDMQCFGGKSFASMKPNGDITPCSYLNDYNCGNINEQTLSEIWGSLSMLCFSVEILKESCEHAEKCRGGCKAISHVFNRSDKCDPYCWVK